MSEESKLAESFSTKEFTMKPYDPSKETVTPEVPAVKAEEPKKEEPVTEVKETVLGEIKETPKAEEPIKENKDNLPPVESPKAPEPW